MKLGNLDSVPADAAAKLEALGIVSTDEFLGNAATAAGRQRLVGQSGLDDVTVKRVARIADLCRIAGLIEPHALLLDALQIPNVRVLCAQNANQLVKALRRKNVELTLVRSVPPESTIERWVRDANQLPLILEE